VTWTYAGLYVLEWVTSAQFVTGMGVAFLLAGAAILTMARRTR
jgi:hypothetical protein